MRVAHIITRLILGGAQENTLLTCLELLRRYHDEVLLITGPGLGPEGSLEERARRERVPMTVIDSLRRNIHPWRDWVSYRALRREIIRFRPDVVHTHSGKAGLFGRQAAWSLGVPAIVHTVHGAPFHPYQGRGARYFFRACERYAARRCHRIISVADAMTDLLVAASVAPREKFVTIHSGMEVEPLLAAGARRAAVRAEFGFQEDEIVVGKIARFFPLKGHEDFVTAAQRVVAERPQTRFFLVGDGILRESIERRIGEAGLRPVFRFSGLVPPERIPDVLSAMDLVVHTSLREGLARVLPQALIAGKPVISYDIDGAREVVVSGETGCLVRPADVAGLTAAIVSLVGSPELRSQLAATGRQRCLAMFRHDEMTDRIRGIYADLLGNRPG